MKRQAFIRELEQAGCVLYRHGAKHDIYQNAVNGKKAPVSRHTEIKNSLYRLIRKQLDLPEDKQ